MKAKKLQAPLAVLLLLVVAYGMNSVADVRQKKAEADAKAAKQAAEAAAAAKSGAAAATHSGPAAFKLPSHSGPVGAPVRLEIFINNSNTCHQGNVTQFGELTKTYGKAIRAEWYSTSDPKVSARADKLKIGCEAGLAINDKVETMVERNGGKVLISFRGPSGDKYKMEDVYRAINEELKRKGKPVPALAKTREKLVAASARPH